MMGWVTPWEIIYLCVGSLMAGFYFLLIRNMEDIYGECYQGLGSVQAGSAEAVLSGFCKTLYNL